MIVDEPALAGLPAARRAREGQEGIVDKRRAARVGVVTKAPLPVM